MNIKLKRSYSLFILSNLFFIAIPACALLLISIVFLKGYSDISGAAINMGYILDNFVEPCLIWSISATILISIFMCIYYLVDINNNKDMELNTKKEWRRRFLKYGFVASSVYYESKYRVYDDSKLFFLEGFIISSRKKMFGI